MFEGVQAQAAVVGSVNGSGKLVVRHGDEIATLFDFSKDIITGCKKSMVPAAFRKS